MLLAVQRVDWKREEVQDEKREEGKKSRNREKIRGAERGGKGTSEED